MEPPQHLSGGGIFMLTYTRFRFAVGKVMYNIMKTSDMIRQLCEQMNISVSE